MGSTFCHYPFSSFGWSNILFKERHNPRCSSACTILCLPSHSSPEPSCWNWQFSRDYFRENLHCDNISARPSSYGMLWGNADLLHDPSVATTLNQRIWRCCWAGIPSHCAKGLKHRRGLALLSWGLKSIKGLQGEMALGNSFLASSVYSVLISSLHCQFYTFLF